MAVILTEKQYREIRQLQEKRKQSLPRVLKYWCGKNGIEYSADLLQQFTSNKIKLAMDAEETNAVIRSLREQVASLQKKEDRNDARAECIINAIQTAVTALPPVKKPTIILKKKHKPEKAMLDLSDMHMGEKVTLQDTAGLNEFNSDIFKQQCARLVQSTHEIINIQRGGGIDCNELIINCLGDLVTNEAIYKSQPFNIDRTVIDQIFELGDYFLKTVIVPYLEIFGKVTMLGVIGNHGRIGQKGDYHWMSNFDMVLMKFWQLAMKDNPRFQIIMADSKFMVYEPFPGQKHLLAHGNEVRSFGQIPFYGLQRYFSKMISLTRQYIDCVHVGHHHTPMNMDVNYGEMIMSGSWVGGSELSVNCMQASNVPSQWFYGVNESHITWQNKIYLRDKPKKIVYNDEYQITTPIVKG